MVTKGECDKGLDGEKSLGEGAVVGSNEVVVDGDSSSIVDILASNDVVEKTQRRVALWKQRGEEAVRARAELKQRASAIFYKLKSNLNFEMKTYPDSLKAVGSNLAGKFYFGRTVLYLFGEGGVEVFNIQSMIRSFGALELNDEELGFISANWLGGRLEAGVARNMMRDPNFAMSALIGVMNFLYSSATNDLTDFFGDIPVSDRIMEKVFVEGSLTLTG